MKSGNISNFALINSRYNGHWWNVGSLFANFTYLLFPAFLVFVSYAEDVAFCCLNFRKTTKNEEDALKRPTEYAI